MSSIGTAYVEIRGDYSKVGKDAGKQGKGFGKKFAAGIAGAVAAAGIGNEIRKSMGLAKSYAKDIAGLSRVTGMDTKATSRWVAVARSRNIEMTKLTMSFTAFSKKIYAAQQGTETAVKVFRKLGISQREIADMDFDQVIGEVADAFKKLENGPKKTAIAQQLFSRSYSALLPLLNEGKIGMEDALAAADKYGLSMGKGQVKAVLAAVKAQRNLNMAVEGFRLGVGTTLVPLLTVVTEKVADFLSQMRTGKGVGGGLVRGVKSTFNRIKKIVDEATAAYGGEGVTLGGLLPDTRSGGQKFADAIAAGIKAADLPGIISTVFEKIDVNKTADTLLKVLLKVVNLAMDPKFWQENWKEIVLLIPIGKIFKIPGLSKLFDLIWPWIKRAFQWLARAGGRFALGVGKEILDQLMKGLSKMPGSFASVAEIAVRALVGKFRSLFGRLRSVGADGGARLLDGVESVGRGMVKIGAWLIRKLWEGVRSLFGFLGKIGRQVGDKIRDGVAGLWKAFYSLGGFLMNKLKDGLMSGIKGLVGIGGRITGAIKKGVGKISIPFGLSGGGAAVGKMGHDKGGFGKVGALASRFGNVVTSGHRPGDPGWHGKNRARDYAGGNMLGFAKAVAARFGGGLLELIHTPLGFGIKNGRKVPSSFFGPAVMADHYDHVHVAMRRGGKAGPSLGGASVVYGEGKKDEWWISQEGDREKNTAWGIEALEAVSRARVALFKKGGKKKKQTAAQKKALAKKRERNERKRRAGKRDLIPSQFDADLAAAELTEDPSDDIAVLDKRINYSKRIAAKLERLLKKKGLPASRRKAYLDSLADVRGSIKSDSDAIGSLRESAGTAGDSSGDLEGAIRDLRNTMEENRKFAESVHTAVKSQSEKTLDQMLDRTMGGHLSQFVLTMSPRMAT